MKSIAAFLISTIVFFFFACKSGSGEKAGPTTNESPVSKETSTQAAFNPNGIMMFEYTVSNFEAIKGIYKPKGKESDVTFQTVAQGLEDSHKAYVIVMVNDIFKRMNDLEKTATKEAITKVADGDPMVRYINIIRTETLNTEYKEKVRVEYRVKDFDTWLKKYDEKGKDVRAAHGLIDRIIGRDLKDPNLVYLFFDISDIEKAKARLASKELDQFMIDAGVITSPVSHFYKVED